MCADRSHACPLCQKRMIVVAVNVPGQGNGPKLTNAFLPLPWGGNAREWIQLECVPCAAGVEWARDDGEFKVTRMWC